MKFEDLKPVHTPKKIKKVRIDKWSHDECIILAQGYRVLAMPELRRRLGGRSNTSICTKASRLRNSGWVLECDRTATKAGLPWSDEDDLYLELHQHQNMDLLMVALSRSAGAIRGRLKLIKERGEPEILTELDPHYIPNVNGTDK